MLTGIDEKAPAIKPVCGICEKKGCDTVWISKVSRVAHSVCIGSITTAEKPYLDHIRHLFDKKVDPERRLTLQAISIARETVRLICSPHTIAEYLEKEGEIPLSLLFINEGLNAALVFKEGVDAANRVDIEDKLRAKL